MDIIVPKASKQPKKLECNNELAPTWDRRSFRMLVCGKAGGGKSVMITNLIRHYLPWDTLTVCAKHVGGDMYQELKEEVEKYEAKLGREVSVWIDQLADLPALEDYTVDNKNLV